MGVIAWIILGLAAGSAARLLVPGKDREGIVLTTALGVIGALLGGYTATNLLHIASVGGLFNPSTWITATAGAVVLLIAYHPIAARGGGRWSGKWTQRHWTQRRRPRRQ